jgi:Methyltransferase domain
MQPAAAAGRAADQKQVLYVGCGPANRNKLHSVFHGAAWKETRLDIDPRTRPDIVSSIAAMQHSVRTATFDALWTSHTIEHLDGHEVPAAFAEFARVLSGKGFALLRCPDLVAVAEAVIARGLDAVAYVSPAGPITPLDMLYGHGDSIARGNPYMRHQTGFSEDRLGNLLLAAGFEEVRTCRKPSFDLWAAAFKPGSDRPAIFAALKRQGLDFGDGGDS